MNRIGTSALIIWLLAVTAESAPPIAAAEPAARITPREGWSAVFGGEEVKFGYAVTSVAPIEGRVVWAYSAQRRTIARSEFPANVGRHGQITIEIPLRIPQLREGVTFDTELHVQLVDDEQDVVAEHRRVVRILGRDVFANRRQWLRGLKIVLYDKQGKTEKTFDEADVPYKLSRNLTALAATTEGLVVVGEGTSFSDHPALPDTLTRLAGGGVSVLCLAPVDGHFEFPGVEDGQPKPAAASLRRNDIIGELDKRLDMVAWPPEGKTVAAGLQPASRRGRVTLSVTGSPQAWPWLEVTYPAGGRLIVCGFRVIGSWEAGPTPRYLLVRILEQLSQGAKPSPNSLEQE